MQGKERVKPAGALTLPWIYFVLTRRSQAASKEDVGLFFWMICSIWTLDQNILKWWKGARRRTDVCCDLLKQIFLFLQVLIMRLWDIRRSAVIVICFLGCNIWKAVTDALREDSDTKGKWNRKGLFGQHFQKDS